MNSSVFSEVLFLHFGEVKMRFLQIVSFRCWKFLLKNFGCLDVIIRVAIWTETQIPHFTNVNSTNLFNGKIGIDN